MSKRFERALVAQRNGRLAPSILPWLRPFARRLRRRVPSPTPREHSRTSGEQPGRNCRRWCSTARGIRRFCARVWHQHSISGLRSKSGRPESSTIATLQGAKPGTGRSAASCRGPDSRSSGARHESRRRRRVTRRDAFASGLGKLAERFDSLHSHSSARRGRPRWTIHGTFHPALSRSIRSLNARAVRRIFSSIRWRSVS